MEEGHAQTERRCEPRYAVDAEAMLVIVHQGGALQGRLFELSLDGCRLRADRRCALTVPAGVEVMFKINGMAFRLGGTMQWVDTHQAAGIQFSPMAPRRRDALLELLAELNSEEQAKAAAAAAKAGNPGANENAARAPAAVLSMPAARRIDSVPPEPALRSLPPVTKPQPAPGPAASIAGGAAKPIFIHPREPGRDNGTPKQASRPVGRDRRAEMRHAVDTGAAIFFIDVRAQITGRILDLSMSGCRVRTNERFPVGIYRRVETEFKLDGLPFRLAGVVQSLHDKFTVGIRFLDMSTRKQDQLAQLMVEIAEMRKAGTEGLRD